MIKKVSMEYGITRQVIKTYEWIRVADDDNGHDEYIEHKAVEYIDNHTLETIAEYNSVMRVNPYTLTRWY